MIAKTAQPTTTQMAFRVSDERLIKRRPGRAKRVSTLLHKQGRPNGVLRVLSPSSAGAAPGCNTKMDLQDQPVNRDFLVETGVVCVWSWTPKARSTLPAAKFDYLTACKAVSRLLNPNAATSCSLRREFRAA